MDLLWFFFLSCVCHAHYAHLFICALWSPAGKGLISWLSFVVYYFEVCHFPICILGQVWCLIVSIPDLCPLSYFQCTFFHSVYHLELFKNHLQLFKIVLHFREYFWQKILPGITANFCSNVMELGDFFTFLSIVCYH